MNKTSKLVLTSICAGALYCGIKMSSDTIFYEQLYKIDPIGPTKTDIVVTNFIQDELNYRRNINNLYFGLGIATGTAIIGHYTRRKSKE
jgi:hypothetical protein